MTKINQGVALDANSPFMSGDSRIIECMVKQADESAFDITGATIKWQMFAISGSGGFTGSAIITKQTGGQGIAITNAEGGVFQITLDPEDTGELAGTYYHESELTTSGGNVHTVFTGTIAIKADAIV